MERSAGNEQQLSEVIVHCGRIAHCFTRWPKRVPLPGPAGWAARNAAPTRQLP
jgi:hypothetical protein